MPQKWRDGKMRTDVDIRPGNDEDARNTNDRGAADYPGCGYPDADLLHGANNIFQNTIRNVRVGDVAGYGDGKLSPIEIGGKVQNIPKIPPMVKFDSRPMTGAGPIEMQRLEQQAKNAIAMGDPDYSPMRELDYESIKDANFRPTAKSAQRKDRDFTG